jgi:Na+/melibiose symporter-like transporter
MKLEWKRIFIIGLAFFSVSIAWGVYNSYVPVFLDRLIAQSTLVGFIMTFDNIAGLIFQPFFGRKSDTTKTRLGRRIPYMVFGVPIAAVFLILIPLHTAGSTTVIQITLLMAAVIGMNFFMSIYRAPAVALMPDATPSPLRSRANGVINFMGGFGAVAAFAVGGWLFKRGEPLPFVFAAVMMILALVALLLFYREPENPYSSDTEGSSKEKGAALFFRKQDKAPLYKQNPSLIFMLLSIFFWFCGYNGVETFFTLFCIHDMTWTPALLPSI